MNYTDQQRATLAQYEEHLRTAVRSDWARNPGPRALNEINDILYAGKTYKPRVNYGCQQCLVRLLRDAGTLYFADLEEIAAKKAEEDLKKSQILAQVQKTIKSSAKTNKPAKTTKK